MHKNIFYIYSIRNYLKFSLLRFHFNLLTVASDRLDQTELSNNRIDVGTLRVCNSFILYNQSYVRRC